ncbi:homeobox protein LUMINIDEPENDENS [Argentina anserina]|uniref:homeobox protein LUMINIDEPENDENS n=1 Tax=Argentina anserina TaxID=57926 RepID=UPI0021764A37|nr:homeobox protein LUMINIDEPENDENS [Potentilla anserina]
MEDLTDLDIGNSVESFHKFVDSQRQLFHSQIDELQRIVVTQCKLTGANPLSQEMAAGALSINIGKRPRDLLNPKAIKYMQSVFSIKDAITKKESRELSALFGVSVSQVREFFNSQRSRVRRIVQLSREKALRSSEHKLLEGVPTSSDPLMPINHLPLNTIGSPINPLPLNTAGSPINPLPLINIDSPSNPLPLNTVGCPSNPLPLNTVGLPSNPLPLNTIGPTNVEEAPSCSTQDTFSGLDDVDKHFVENIFNLMRIEETFSGQVKLLELILRIQNSSVLCWFLTKGGVMILVTWLTQAADEEQTSVLLVILKVFCHLPLSKALPVHMSAILQSVNRLRFYRTSEISNRARVLLSRWSKSLARSQALKKPNGMKTSNDSQELALLKRSIDEAISDDPWNSNGDGHEDILALSYESAIKSRKLESSEPMKLLIASSDDLNKKHILGISASQFKGRRKVQLVEQPGQKTAGRSSQAARPTPVSQARPMSVDDIQKAKLRAQYMQSKYGKSAPSNENKDVKAEGVNNLPISQASNLPVVPNIPVQSNREESKIPVTLPLKERETPDISVQPIASFQPIAPKLKTDMKEHIWEKCRRVQVLWKMPPEVKLNPEWRVGGGENGKEMEVQKNRNHRERETIYNTLKEIPPNPKEPWDVEMDYDDSLTPVIPTEQPPDTDCTETQPAHSQEVNNAAETLVVPSQEVNSVASLAPLNNTASSTAEPDIELLAVLLKNPELVFALTSGQASNLSSEDTVKLLDMIKAGGAAFAGNLNGLASKMEEKVEVSLPSPTPASNPGTSGWRPEATRNAFSQQNLMQNRVSHGYSSPEMAANNNLVPSQLSSALTSPLPQRLTSAIRAVPAYSPEHVHQIPDSTTLPSHLQHNYSNMAVPSVWGESTSNGRPEPSYNSFNVAAERQPNSLPSPFLSTPIHQQRHSPQPVQRQNHYSESPYFSKPPTVKHGLPLSDSWRSDRQGLPSNYRYLENQNQYYNAPSYGGPLQQQAQLRSGPPYEGSEYMSNGGGFESWSPPEDSPARNAEYNMYGRNAYGPADRSRQRNTQTPGYQDYSRQGHRWPNRGRH